MLKSIAKNEQSKQESLLTLNPGDQPCLIVNKDGFTGLVLGVYHDKVSKSPLSNRVRVLWLAYVRDTKTDLTTINDGGSFETVTVYDLREYGYRKAEKSISVTIQNQ